ncbi:MAG: DinB family protein [Ferruginibacter sp.]
METQTFDKKEILSSIADAVKQITDLMSAVDENKVNTIPYEGSWTAPQLLIHVAKSIDAMANAMQMDGKQTERDPGERVEELKKIFLDFSHKLQSPEFIIPEPGIFEKQPVIGKINDSYRQFDENTGMADLNILVEGLPFGPVTKLEITYFTLFHTQRHLHQMKKICEALKSK